MKIGIFGGSFNPPHKMHEILVKELLDKGYVDRIIFVPTGSKYEYKHNLISDNDRLEMLKIIAKNDSRISVSDYELKDHVVYTCESLKHFSEVYPNDLIYFICGADNLSYIDKWKNGTWILENYKIIVVNRVGEDISLLLDKFSKYNNNIIVSDIEMNNISSTIVREALKNRDDVSKYLNSDVLKCIRERKLYEVDDEKDN